MMITQTANISGASLSGTLSNVFANAVEGDQLVIYNGTGAVLEIVLTASGSRPAEPFIVPAFKDLVAVGLFDAPSMQARILSGSAGSGSLVVNVVKGWA